MSRIVIWQGKEVNSGDCFYVLSTEALDRCAVFEGGSLYMDTDFKGFGFGKYHSVVIGFEDTLILDVKWDLNTLATDDDLDLFCMINCLDNSLKDLLKFAYTNKKELIGED